MARQTTDTLAAISGAGLGPISYWLLRIGGVNRVLPVGSYAIAALAAFLVLSGFALFDPALDEGLRRIVIVSLFFALAGIPLVFGGSLVGLRLLIECKENFAAIAEDRRDIEAAFAATVARLAGFRPTLAGGLVFGAVITFALFRHFSDEMPTLATSYSVWPLFTVFFLSAFGIGVGLVCIASSVFLFRALFATSLSTHYNYYRCRTISLLHMRLALLCLACYVNYVAYLFVLMALGLELTALVQWLMLAVGLLVFVLFLYPQVLIRNWLNDCRNSLIAAKAARLEKMNAAQGSESTDVSTLLSEIRSVGQLPIWPVSWQRISSYFGSCVVPAVSLFLDAGDIDAIAAVVKPILLPS